uniref:Diacylglycerol kinase n=1 Tax=Strongyloides stercoralis TaxID=6248 RepID=A0A0K0EBU9_STRER
MLKYESSTSDYTLKYKFFKQYLMNFILFLIIINHTIHVTCENSTTINNIVNINEVKMISHNNAYKLVQLLVFYNAKEFTGDKKFIVQLYIHKIIKIAGELLYPLNIFLSISDYIEIKNTSTIINDITYFKNLYTVMNHKKLPPHNLAMIASEFLPNTHAYRRGLCSEGHNNILAAKIHLKEFNDYYLIKDGEEIAYSIISMIGFTMDDEMIKDEFYNCTCLNDKQKCFTVYNDDNCLLHRLLHRFEKVDCLHKSYKYFDGYSIDPICGNGIVEKGEVCDGGPEVYGGSLSLSLILIIFIILLLFAVIYYRYKNSKKRKILKNLSTSSNYLYDSRCPNTSKFNYNNKKLKNNIIENDTISSNHTSNSGHSRTIIGLGKDNDTEDRLKQLNKKEKSQLDDKSSNTLPLINKSSSNTALSFEESSEPTSILLDTTTTSNSFGESPSSETLSGVFLSRSKHGKLPNSTINSFPKNKSRKNIPSPLVSHSMNVDLPSTVILTVKSFNKKILSQHQYHYHHHPQQQQQQPEIVTEAPGIEYYSKCQEVSNYCCEEGMAAEGHNVDATLLSSTTIGKDHGHFFVKKTFGKPMYCHHCCDKIWGMISQGYACEVCNFVCHDKCLKTIVSYCSGVALQLIKNPVAHTWTEPGIIKKHFCSVCRKKTDDSLSKECEVCEYYVHVECQDLAVSDCREAATYIPSIDQSAQKQLHHMREGNLPKDSKCVVCKKSCYSFECLTGMRCEWCSQTVHATCYRMMNPECDFGPLRKIMLPPNCLTIPRTELPMEQLLNIHSNINGDGTNTNTTNEYGNATKIDKKSSNQFNDDNNNGCDEKERDDYEILKIYDGNYSLRNQVFRTISVPKVASVEQIRDIALRKFNIYDTSDNYFLTQVPTEHGGEEELLEDPVPLRNVKRPEGRRAQLFLRHKDDPEKAIVKIYGGWLRIPITFTEIYVNRETLVQDVLSEALTSFGLDKNNWNKYNLIEVSLERGVVERTANPQENMLQLFRNLKKDSLRRFHVVRFYIQEKEDPHDHAVFVGNLPVSLAQRQYERILLKLLGAKEKPFTAIGPIYFEYGSLVITFNTPKAATAAVQKLQNAMYEDKKLIVLCLPNIQQHMIPSDVEPLLVLVNTKSGGCQGNELITAFRRQLNPFQVFDVLKGGPLVGLYVFRNIPKYRILACGGDGTIGWVLQCLDIVKQEAACFSPPCGIVPLGTGNDLARVLRWGGGYTGEENPLDILKDVIEAEEVRLDRWAVVFHEEEKQPANPGREGEIIPDREQTMTNPEDQTSMIIMNNYFGIGIDADVCLKFHNKRDANPEKFQSRLFNKTQYVKIGLQKALFERSCKDLWKRIELEVDGKMIELPNIEGIVILNLLSWGSGANPWGTAKEEGVFQKPTHYDGLLEVVGIPDVSRLGLIQSKLAAGIRIAQGGSIRITTHEEWPVQVDGEPHIQPPGTITILKSALKATMLDRPSNKKIRERKKREKEEEQNRVGRIGVPLTVTVSGNDKNNKEKESSRNNIFKFKRRVFKKANRRSFENKKIEDSSRRKTKHQNIPGVEKEYHSAIELTNELSTSSIQNDNSC